MIRFFRLLDHDPGLRLQIASSTLGKDALISNHRADTLTDVAVEDARVRVTRIEVQAVGAARVRRELRGRPIVAVRTGIVEGGVVADARCRQEDATTIGSGKQSAANAVLRRPSGSTVVSLFILLLF